MREQIEKPHLVYYLGVDPGASGGLAAIGGSGCVDLLAMPEGEKEIWDWLQHHNPPFGAIELYAVVEKVSGWIGGNQGTDKEGIPYKHQGQPGSAMFKFGQSYGALRMALVGAGLVEDKNFWAVAPQTWQKGLEIEGRRGKQGETRPQFKSRLKTVAQSLYPSEHVTLKTCDALLLAEYCKRKVECLL